MTGVTVLSSFLLLSVKSQVHEIDGHLSFKLEYFRAAAVVSSSEERVASL
jgi:hypothetical protein